MSHKPHPQKNLMIRLFGAPEIQLDGVTITGLPAKTQALLFYLVVTGQPHLRAKLASLLWGEMLEKNARGNLRKAIRQLQAILPNHLSLEQQSVSLDESVHLSVDVITFEQQIDQSEAAHDIQPIEEAVALYRGDFLAGFLVRQAPDFEAWQAAQHTRLRDLMMSALQTLSRDQLAKHQLEPAIATTRRILEIEPWREEAHRQLMELLAQNGQRTAALVQFERCKAILAEELSVAPGDEMVTFYQKLQQLERANNRAASVNFAATVGNKPRTDTSSTSLKHNIPRQITSFFGRDRELKAILDILVNRSPKVLKDSDTAYASPVNNRVPARLVSLTGVGGCGKTRLALELATILHKNETITCPYSDGIWFMEFAPLGNPEQIAQVVAAPFNLPENANHSPIDALIGHLQAKHVLLIFDNCEHLLESTANLSKSLLQSCPDITILITSRAPLNMPGEVVFPIPSLEILNVSTACFTDIAECEAVRLFCDRAAAALPHFRLTEENAVDVARICQWLDGIPLAIELAAARVRMLTPQQIANRLGDTLLLIRNTRSVTPRHHHSLQATLEWSYNLLNIAEQALFRGLAVFADGWSLEIVEQIMSDETMSMADIFNLHERVFDQSLIVRLDDGQNQQARYRLLEPVRQYATQKLVENRERQQLHSRHLDWCIALAEAAEKPMLGPNQAAWLDRLEKELPNIRVSLDWSLEAQALEQGFRLAGALWPFWETHSRYSEGLDWLERLLAQANEAEMIDLYARMKVLFASGILYWQHDLYDRARDRLEAAIAIAQEIRADWFFAFGLCRLGRVLRAQGKRTEAQDCFENSLALFRHLADTWGISRPLRDLGLLALNDGRYAEATQHLQEALAMRRAANDLDGVADALNYLGTVARLEGKLSLAEAHYREALGYYQAIGYREGLAAIHKSLGLIALNRIHLPQAEKHFKQGLVLHHEIGTQNDIAAILIGLQALAIAQSTPEQVARLENLLERIAPPQDRMIASEYRSLHKTALDTATAILGEQNFAILKQQGHTLTVEQLLSDMGHTS